MIPVPKLIRPYGTGQPTIIDLTEYYTVIHF